MRYIAIIPLMVLALLACEKDSDQQPEPASLPIGFVHPAPYIMLTEGNYWVYQRHTVDLKTGQVTAQQVFDSLSVSGDTVIDNLRYFILEGTWFGQPFWRAVRNTGSELVSHRGTVYFRTNTTAVDTLRRETDVASMQIDSLHDIMRKQTLPIASPAGTFDSEYHFDRTFYLDTAAIPDPKYHIRHDKEYYVEKIGVVRYTSFYSSPTDLEMRLIRYKVQE